MKTESTNTTKTNILINIFFCFLITFFLSACNTSISQETKNLKKVNMKQTQPVNTFDQSFEHRLITTLYNLRSKRVVTHTVWRSDSGLIEGNCSSIGYGIPVSKSKTAKWIMCIGTSEQIEPVYVESNVTIYPCPIKVDYDLNRVTKSGVATVMIPKK